MSQRRILVVDDDPQIQRMLRSQLGLRGYEVSIVGDGPAALLAVADQTPDVVLLDLTLPGMDGLEVCRQLREWSAVPVILLTATDEIPTKITALDAGADDYLTKPFHMEELMARVRAVLRRAMAHAEPLPPVISHGELTIDLPRHEWRLGTPEVRLTRTQFELLHELSNHPENGLT